MKINLLKTSFWIIASILSLESFATIRTVNNNPNSPGQYINLTDAIDAASEGDTIMIAGSNTSHGNVTISKKLTLIGTGYSPRKDVSLLSKIGSISLSAGTSNNSVFIGLYVEASISGSGAALSTINIRRSFIGGLDFNSVSNVNILNCIIVGNVGIANCNNFLIANNIISGYLNGNLATNVLVRNNLFTSTYVGANIDNVLYSNNIFYYRYSSSNTSDLCSACSNNVFNNNIYFNQKENPLPIGLNNNTGTANISANPQFNKITTDGNFSNDIFFDDYRLQSGSPALNSGTDGKDVGIYGGAIPIDYPLAGEPPVPQIKSMTINNNVVPPGGTLDVNVKAKKAN